MYSLHGVCSKKTVELPFGNEKTKLQALPDSLLCAAATGAGEADHGLVRQADGSTGTTGLSLALFVLNKNGAGFSAIEYRGRVTIREKGYVR